jgi:hypothetical protein
MLEANVVHSGIGKKWLERYKRGSFPSLSGGFVQLQNETTF